MVNQSSSMEFCSKLSNFCVLTPKKDTKTAKLISRLFFGSPQEFAVDEQLRWR
jgi:hypothetical protein